MTIRSVPAPKAFRSGFLRLLGVFLAALVARLEAAPTTVDFATTSGRFLGLAVSDGQHGSTDVPGLTLTFSLAHASGTANGSGVYYFNAGNGVDGISGNDGWGDPMLVIKAQANARFSFNGFRVVNSPNGPAVNKITVTGLAAGNAIGSVDLALTAGVGATFTTSHLPAPIFGAVDEVRITSREEPFGPVQGPRLLNLFNRFVVDPIASAPTKTPQTISFAALADRPASAPAFALTATASSGLPVSFSVVSGPATFAGGTLTLTGAPGTVTLKASQSGNPTYEAAPDVTRSFTVTAAISRVFFANLVNGTTKVGDFAAVLSPTGNIGHIVIVAPSVNLSFAVDVTLRPDGTFVKAIAGVGVPPAANDGATPPRAGAAQTVTLRGTANGDVLSGGFDELPYTFIATAQGPGPGSGVAGVYLATMLNAASGSTTAIVGHNNEVVALAVTDTTSIGGHTTLASDGTFEIIAGTSSLSGAVTSDGITGMVRQASRPSLSYSGVSFAVVRTDRLINLSSRVRVSPTAGRSLIVGFVIGGPTQKRVLLRAIGPTLANFNVTDALDNPRLELYDAAGARLLQNEDWSGADTAAAFVQVGAFALAPGTRDAALLTTLAPGAYTMHVLDGGESGVALAEIYDASATASTDPQRLINISSRGFIDADAGSLIGGFVVTGNVPKRLLVRGVGPALGAFGVAGTLADPRLAVFSAQTMIAQNDDWDLPTTIPGGQAVATADQLVAAAQAAGAFAFGPGSKDAAVIVTLAPGAYTAQVSSSDASSGAALVEIYEIPQ